MKHFKRRNFLIALFSLAAGAALRAPVCAAEKALRINLGTLAPRGSTYHQSLQAMAEKWKQAPGGGARLVIYPDGTQGGEVRHYGRIGGDLAEEVNHFLRSVRDDKDFLVSVADAVRAVAVNDAIIRSLRSNSLEVVDQGAC